MGAEHEPMNRIPGGKDFGFGRRLAHWPPEVALKAPKLPSKERVYTEKKMTLRKCTPVQCVRGITCAWRPLSRERMLAGGFFRPPTTR